MVNDVIIQLKEKLIVEDLYYIGGACDRRINDDEGNPISNLWGNDTVRALLENNTVIRKRNGDKFGAQDIRQLINDGRLTFAYSRVDKSPHDVCDRADTLAQSAMHATHLSSSMVRHLASGTVSKGDFVEECGYPIFGWILHGAVTADDLSVITFIRREVTATETLQALQKAAYKSRGLSTGILSDMGDIPHVVRLQRVQQQGLSRKKTGYLSHVDGHPHVRMWGPLNKPEKWMSITMDFGGGNEAAALASHVRIVQEKTSSKYALRRGAYEKLADNVPFSHPKVDDDDNEDDVLDDDDSDDEVDDAREIL